MPAARLLVLLLLSASAFADTAKPASEDPALEKRVLSLSSELRCLVCQNQTLADSNAPLAVDLRNQVRDQLKSGKTEGDVREFMVARYGDFVLYRPPFKPSTALLWGGPFLLLLAGVIVLARRLRRRPEPPAELSPADRERAAKLLE
jgi:cytochrome c-type biogenesis protein CcmH